MDCVTARLLMPFANRPGELPAEDAERLRQHLDACPGCRQLMERERSFDAAISRAMVQVEVPAGLRERIGVGLAQQRGRVIQRRTVQIAALAAMLLLALGSWWAWGSRIVIHPEQLVQSEDEHFVVAFNGNVEAAEQWFRSHGLKTKLPPELNYALLTNLEVVSFRGHDAARLDFENAGSRMKIYVLPRRHFRLARNAVDEAVGSHATIEVVEASDEFLFVYVYFNGANRAMFLQSALVG